MTREHDEQSHPASLRRRVGKRAALFAVYGAPLAWFVQFCAAFAFNTSPCFDAGERLFSRPGLHPWAAIISVLCLAVALAALWLGLVHLRRTREEEPGGERGLIETGQGRTRFLAIWAIAFAGVFTVLIAINILLLLGVSPCAV
ncbi:MAG: hypothetical protein J0I69_07255 [Altererythrobacter sp.]|nr:hypothetical protein [Altererythrobacter sp.]OJU60861.1 MAG: hypothetical protein BGO08_12040 [Altererythrobacter sp. 66-12]